MKIEQTLQPSAEYITFLREMIDAEDPDKYAISEVAFFMRNDEGEIIAGCNCFVFCGAIYTDQLWVHKSYRKQGFGRKLLDEVHNYGREAGCTMTTIATMSYQKALGFYEELGYVADFTREGYMDGSKAIFLKKEL